MKERGEPLIEDAGFSQLLGIIIAVFAVILTLLLFALWQRRKSAGRNLLITGLSDAGKTVLYAKLVHSKFVETYLSAKENIGDIKVKDRQFQIVDIPGHERLRYKFFDQYKSTARGLIFVIDSVTVQKEIRDVAEYLYTLLSDPSIHSNIPVLILCNKQDQTMAKGSNVIKTLLEKELNLVRVTKSKQLEATDATIASTFIGIVGKDFEFAHLDNRIDFAECSACNKNSESNADIDQLQTWLNKVLS